MQADIGKPCSRLEQVLLAGRFAVTSELNPPDSADPEDVYRAALVLRKSVTASMRWMLRGPTAICRVWRSALC